MGKFVVVCFFFCRVYYVNSCNSNKSKGKLKAMWGGGGGGKPYSACCLPNCLSVCLSVCLSSLIVITHAYDTKSAFFKKNLALKSLDWDVLV